MSRQALCGGILIVRTRFLRLGNTVSAPWSKFTLFAALTILSTATVVTASARSRHRGDTERKQQAEEPAPPSGPLFLIISTGKQHVTVYGNNGFYARSPVSTGRPDHPTPMGIFNIIGKERYHHSNIYSGAPMPFMQRITYSGVAMHEGVLPGYAASHGCIRMPHEFARRMFGFTQGNERVIITRQDIVPASFSHPRLPVPAFMPIPGSDNIASGSTQMLQNALATADISRRTGGSERVDVSVKADTGEAKPEDSTRKLLNPLDFAKAMKARAAKRAEEAAAAVNPARDAVEVKSREVKVAAVDLRKAEIALSNAKDRLQSADQQLKKASGEEAVSAATAAKTTAESKVAEAEAVVQATRRAKAEKDQDVASAIRAYKDVDNARKAAADSVKSWNRRLAPISVFISRQTQRLYVRQGYIKVFDVPVTIRDPEKPLGTHLYMAMQPVQSGDGSTPTLRWLVLTIPESAIGESDSRSRHRRRGRDDADDTPRAVSTTSASAALDRIEVPAEVAGKISEMLWAGGSLIVSDSGISRETGDHTDFIILTR
jgi:hypothetical protein